MWLSHTVNITIGSTHDRFKMFKCVNNKKFNQNRSEWMNQQLFHHRCYHEKRSMARQDDACVMCRKEHLPVWELYRAEYVRVFTTCHTHTRYTGMLCSSSVVWKCQVINRLKLNDATLISSASYISPPTSCWMTPLYCNSGKPEMQSFYKLWNSEQYDEVGMNYNPLTVHMLYVSSKRVPQMLVFYVEKDLENIVKHS